MSLFNGMKTRFIVIFTITFVVITALLFVYSIHVRRQTIDYYKLFFKQWESQQPNNYLLTYSSSNYGNCTYTIKVANGMPKIVKTAHSANNDFCEYLTPSWLNEEQPMTSLFNDLIQLNYPRCGANGCICDNINNLTVKFDKQLGYIQSWKEINSGGFTPYRTARFSLGISCHTMYSQPVDFSVYLRPL
ncbi:hypothetical protein Lfee_1389 [Legionella feeleii]|uniref:Uncharacterized protein n=2 Tax=Legionella feeleii TaxID=453 RepID=A0A0W0TU90_9GAMM|nr:hypothetical protein Lfee_1389 [Legionella feeleii]SPX61079.1 Uncharacterised protein [Legionella feeleii]